ncbi:hypothetical protein SRHO_G00100840, partial [Serrasalmus rhombeus]
AGKRSAGSRRSAAVELLAFLLKPYPDLTCGFSGPRLWRVSSNSVFVQHLKGQHCSAYRPVRRMRRDSSARRRKPSTPKRRSPPRPPPPRTRRSSGPSETPPRKKRRFRPGYESTDGNPEISEVYGPAPAQGAVLAP